MQATLLIASPQMQDTFFEGTVVLLWHHDEDGAVGVVINRPVEQPLLDSVSFPDGTDIAYLQGETAYWGGPVEMQTGTVVARHPVSDDDGWNLPCGISVSRSLDALFAVVEAQKPFCLAMGYAGWSAGQLEDELDQGAWLWTEADAALVLDAPADARYALALATLGLSPDTVWMTPAEA